MTDYRKLMKMAYEAGAFAYAPYSGFRVGAALLFEDGTVVTGCNVENSSYGLTLCAERNAMTTAVAQGLVMPVAAAVAGEKGKPCMPCGACRQFLAEFNPDLEIVTEENDRLSVFKLSELLPCCFTFDKKN